MAEQDEKNVASLVLHNRDEAGIPFTEGRSMVTLIPGARFVPLNSKSHILLGEEPAWQRFPAEAHACLGVLGRRRRHPNPKYY